MFFWALIKYSNFILLCDQRICHRDLKLENILLDGSQAPRIKICDFGYSKVNFFVLSPKKSKINIYLVVFLSSLSNIYTCGCMVNGVGSKIGREENT